jgi:3-deoxy-D-manno-octulosonic-acid transferase
MLLLYQLFANSIRAFIKFWGIFSSKKKELVEQRSTYKKKTSLLPTLWFHASSYGEFEGILPIIIEAKQEGNHFILCSFFSPSGYEPLKDDHLLDQVVYAPFDVKKDVDHFLQEFAPASLIVSQNDFWPQMIRSCINKQIPVYFVGTYLRSNHWWLKTYGRPLTSILKDVSGIYLQDKESYDLLTNAGFVNCKVTGNPRIDQVIQNAEENKAYPILEEYSKRKTLMVCGSTLAKDDTIILEAIEKLEHVNILIVPHEPFTFDDNQLSKFAWIRYSEIEKICPPDIRIILLDTLGDLKYVYRYAKMAYVGGGFDAGVHSVLEPAVFNIPLISGPNIRKFKSAVELQDLNCLTIVENKEALIKAINTLNDQNNQHLSTTLSQYISTNQGASKQIWESMRL